MSLIKKWNDLGLFTKIMIGFVLGIVAGLVLGEKATSLEFLGTILTLPADNGGSAAGAGSFDLLRR